jgi:hypothetical protein
MNDSLEEISWNTIVVNVKSASAPLDWLNVPTLQLFARDGCSQGLSFQGVFDRHFDMQLR